MRCIAGITTYQPDIARLKQNVDSISGQVETVVLVDNGSENYSKIEFLANNYDNVVIVNNKENKGIAYAMNVIGDYAFENGYDWFLTLDQDSVCPNNLITTYCQYVANDIGILAPFIAETNPFVGQLFRRGEDRKIKPESEVDKVLFAVSSGQFINTRAWHEADGFWNYLFIDYVDQELCFHLTRLGYKILRINSLELSHVQGVPLYIFGIETAQQSALREYYCARNSRLVYWLYPSEFVMGSPHRPFCLTLKRIANVLLVRRDVMNKLVFIFRGVRDAYRWKSQYGKGQRKPNNDNREEWR